ncbi:MAG: C25 family cysteine peptidase [candidate division WOR-3 bacterium]|nr:C25 family cysteine peptidase [candidate division WOR-3 bacterium]
MRYLAVALFALSVGQASVLVKKLDFRPSQFTFENGPRLGAVPVAYDVVLGEGMDVSDEPGAPQLPVQPVVVALPGRCQVTGVTFEVSGWQAMDGQHQVVPCQKQQVLSTPEGMDGFTSPNPAIYQSTTPYPASPAKWTGTSFRHDSTFVQVLVYPVRYVGAEQRLEVCREVKVKVEGRTKSEARSQKLEARSPDAVSGERLADGAFEYVIVTGEGYDSVFQRLADWKTQKGVPAVVRTVEWMYANYPGRDQAEQVRNYLKTLPDSGVKYALLAGDVNVVPFRKAFAMNCEWGAMQREDSLPCDLYFADLDGSWDANGNGVFGEVDDSVDLYADLSVGRAPVDGIEEAQTFVRKVIDYEHGTVAGYQNKGLFFAEILWQNPYTDQGVHKNKMEQQSFASGYSLTKLYQSLGNETRPAVMQAMRENQNFMNHDGHGWIDVMECGGSANRMYTADADTITNAGLGVLYSIGCWTTAFDFVSIGEAFVTNPNGGTVATIGNSSYGWGSPGNPGFGYSDKYDNHFWHAITSEGDYHVGDALVAAKEYYAPFSHDKNVYRWHQYEVNLMGDPEMPVRTAQPESLVVTAPLSVGLGQGRYLVTVAHAGAPVAGALVCLANPGEVYSRGLTDAAGRVWLDADPQTVGWLNLTVTAHNFYPYQGEVACDSGNYVNFAGWRVDDRAGNGDGIANPGETVVLPFVLRNTGDAASGPATVTLITNDARVTLLDSVVSVPGINPGDSVQVDSGLRVAVQAGPYDGAVVVFTMNVTSGCLVRTFSPVLPIGEAVLTLDRWWLNQPPLSPGASRGLGVRLLNRGHGYGHGTWCRLVSLDSLVLVAEDSVGYGEVQPKSYGSSADSFMVAASSSCPAGHVALMELQTHADRSLERDTLELLVGEYGFEDDMESGESKWSHGGTGDMWHLTSCRTHSGANAWYCGDEGTRQYNSNMDAWLTTVPFTVPQGCSLRFWRWFATPNYGVDGIRVIVLRGTAEDTLDFVGTGGALGPLECGSEAPAFPRPRQSGSAAAALQRSSASEPPGASPFVNQSNWAEEKYDLSWLGLGETVQVKIAFVSDGDTVDEGFYIDDVRVTGGGPPVVAIAGVEPAPGPVAALDAWPNPFRRTVRIQCGAALGHEPPQLSVYDASGRMVRRLPSVWSTTWDGRSGSGQLLPAGAYFIEARTASERRIAKVLMAY